MSHFLCVCGYWTHYGWILGHTGIVTTTAAVCETETPKVAFLPQGPHPYKSGSACAYV